MELVDETIIKQTGRLNSKHRSKNLTPEEGLTMVLRYPKEMLLESLFPTGLSVCFSLDTLGFAPRGHRKLK